MAETIDKPLEEISMERCIELMKKKGKTPEEAKEFCKELQQDADMRLDPLLPGVFVTTGFDAETKRPIRKKIR